jgi:hypothetical protein
VTINRLVDLHGAGVGSTILDGGLADRVVLVDGGYTSEITDLTIQNGKATFQGGGILNYGHLTLNNVEIIDNEASGGPGGGIWSDTGSISSLTINDSTIDNNSGLGGGGIYARGATDIKNTTISNNDGGASNSGGGLFSDSGAATTLENVTLTGNQAAAAGGIGTHGIITLTNTTVVSNTAGNSIGPGIQAYGATYSLNTIVAYNTGGSQCTIGGGGSFTSLGYNLESTDTCSFNQTGDQVNADPKLAALADNGGATLTHALLPGSDAIDQGTNTGCPATDQRGVVRPQGGTCDVGAYEAGGGAPTATPTATSTAVMTPTATPVNNNIFYISKTGSDGKHCLNWDNACLTIAGAIGKSAPGATFHIGAGTFVENTYLFNSYTLIGLGADQTILDGNDADHTLYITAGVTVSVQDLTIQNGNASTGPGGGVFNNGDTIMTRVIIKDNSSTTDSGGIHNAAASQLLMTDSRIEGNDAVENGGGLGNGGSATLKRVLVSGNMAPGSSEGYGGGIYQHGNAISMTNVTISGGSAAAGGGFYNSSGDATFSHVTISANTATSGDGGGVYIDDMTASFLNTIVGGNTGTQCAGAGTFQSNGGNIESHDTCGFDQTSDQPSVDPKLAALADNAGFSMTHALMAGSPAIDGGLSQGCPSKDQRSAFRPNGTGCDSGAYEYDQGQYFLYLPLINRP